MSNGFSLDPSISYDVINVLFFEDNIIRNIILFTYSSVIASVKLSYSFIYITYFEIYNFIIKIV